MVMPPEVLYFIGLFWLAWVFVLPYKVDYCFLKVCEEFCWDFDGDSIESIDCFWQNCHFYYVDLTNPRAWEILSLPGILFNFFHQGLKVLVK